MDIGLYLVMVDICGDRQMEELIVSVLMKGNRCFPLSLQYINQTMVNKPTIEELS